MHYDIFMHRNALTPKPYIYWAFGKPQVLCTVRVEVAMAGLGCTWVFPINI